MIDLAARRALITGGNRGLGLAIAAAYVEAGAHVAIGGRSEREGKVASDRLGVIWVPGDVSGAEAAHGIVGRAVEALSGLDILVNNAGRIIRKLALEVDDGDWDQLLAVNVKAVFHCAVAAASHMRERGGGKIINVSSLGARVAAPGRVIYGPTKAAVAQMTRVMAVEWAPFNIQVNAISPGWIRTDMNATFLDANPEELQRIRERIPAGRLGRPEDVAGLAVFLASRASDYVTGQVVEIDGGLGVT